MRHIQVVNLTPHDVRIIDTRPDGDLPYRVVSVYPKSGFIARAHYETKLLEEVIDQEGNVIKITNTKYKMVNPLPPPVEGVYYLVSKVVADLHTLTRDDLYVVSSKVYDNKGVLQGVRGLALLKRIGTNA